MLHFISPLVLWRLPPRRLAPCRPSPAPAQKEQEGPGGAGMQAPKETQRPQSLQTPRSTQGCCLHRTHRQASSCQSQASSCLALHRARTSSIAGMMSFSAMVMSSISA